MDIDSLLAKSSSRLKLLRQSNEIFQFIIMNLVKILSNLAKYFQAFLEINVIFLL